jgi:hypothetical protein
MAVHGPVDETQPVPVQDVQGNLDNGDSSDEQDETKAKVQELEQAQAKPDVPVASSSQVQVQVLDRTPSPTPPPQRRRKLYTSPRWVTALGYLLCGVVILANGYVIVQLGLGNG